MKRVLTLVILLWTTAALGQSAADPADHLWDLYKEGRFEEVVKQGTGLLNTGTETAQVNLAVGRGLADLDRWKEAVPFLEKAAAGDPARTWVYAWAQVYLGVVHAKLGELDQARDAFLLGRNCRATQNATRTAASNLMVLGLDEFFDPWTPFETEHFSFRFSPRLAVFDRVGFAREREQAYAAISAWFGGGPARKIRFFVWADPAEAAAAQFPALGFSRPDDYLIHASAGQTAGHELAHVISDEVMQPTVKTGLINEGVSVALDQTGRDTLDRARRAVAQGAAGQGASPFLRVDLRALWEDFDLLEDEYTYPIAGAWVDHLLAAGGKPRFLEFFRDQSLDHARQVYGPDLEDWIDGFQARLYANP